MAVPHSRLPIAGVSISCLMAGVVSAVAAGGSMQMAGLAADLAVQQAKRSTMEQHEATEV